MSGIKKPADTLPPGSGQVIEALPRKLEEGDVVGGYMVLGHLFTGGMGDVYVAVHETLDRHVALKVPRLDSGAVRFNRRRLLAEAKVLARVAHVNVVTVYDFRATSDGLEYLVMELLDGRALDEILVANPQLVITHAIRIAREIARGLAALHRAGIYHVDLKPENIMIVKGPLVQKLVAGENWVKLIDLGTARMAYDELAHGGDPLVGTPGYIAPEAILDQPVDNRADLYALGAVFYEMAAGCLPYPSVDGAALVKAQVKRTPAPLSKYRDEVSAGCALERLIADCLERDPDRRPESMIDFLGRLDQAVRQGWTGRQ